jgi:hypothetical protein
VPLLQNKRTYPPATAGGTDLIAWVRVGLELLGQLPATLNESKNLSTSAELASFLASAITW